MIHPGAAAFPRRAPGWPLLATLGLHLLLAWSWRVAQPPVGDVRGERVFNVIPVVPPAPATPEVRPEPPARTTITPRARTGPAPAGTLREPEPPPPPGHLLEAPATVADPFAITAPPASPESPGDATAGRARGAAGAIDRELRKGKSGVPEVADTPWGRFMRGVGAAYNESARSLVSETYTAPDGQIIYRFHLGGKTWCRTGGGVKPRIGGAEGGGATMFDTQGGGGSAGMIRCPSHGNWKRN